MLETGNMTIRTLASREIYRNRWMTLREDEIERDNGSRGIYSVVDKSDGAIIIALQADSIFLVEQFRYTILERCLEMPQGAWEGEIAMPEDLARGELREETGLTASNMTQLGTIQIGYGFTNQRQHVFLAEGLVPGDQDRDHEEHDLTVTSLPVPQFEQLILDGTIRDASTLAAWALYKLWREKHPAS